MYPQMNKEQMPSAPPSYTESVNAPKYAFDPQQAGSQYPQYPPPPMGPGQPNQVIVVQVVPGIPPLGPQPVELTCPSCKAVVMTSIEKESSNNAYLCCMFLFIFGCGLCSCLPFCMDNFQNYKHTCPRCNTFIGAYQPT